MPKHWFQKIEERLKEATENGEEFGACLLPDPNGGPQVCTQMDQATCTNLGGRFVGGDCG
jgi:hypothetical protein